MTLRLIRHLFLLATPLILKYLFFLVFVDWGVFDHEDLVEDAIFFCSVSLLIHIQFFQNKLFNNLLLFVYIFYVVLETTSYLAVSSTFSSSYMYLLLESSSSELKEFAGGYFNWKILLVFLANSLLFLKLRNVNFKVDFKYSNSIGFSGALVILLFLKFTGFIESNAYHNAVRGVYGYVDLQNGMQLSSNIKAADLQITADNDVLVLVLGESTNRSHMQIYGYNKPTTPLLNTIKDSLYIFNNVISTDVFTLKAVPKILTSLSDMSSGNLTDIVQVFNAADYDTYWLSNQRPISYHDNAISKIASKSKSFKFYNHLIDRDTKILDEEILPDYEELLDKPGKKLIVLRLIGTHFDYDNRYPASFNRFDNNPNISEKERLRNQYDNAILYNDFIVHEILSKLKAKNQKSAMVYISDHGENIYDEGTDFFGRNEEILTKSMFEIPFVLWVSDEFEKPIDFEYNKNMPFTSQFTYDSLGHLFGIMHTSMTKENSVFSKSYTPKKRMVVGNKNFDTYFNSTDLND
ncbi:heptose-I-phosphate ethanolaminephosphotransferase [Winogradskyella wandonensis]|uniref:Heptose-I-phosphate ethanolaminephosphotransferase n=1 Tax=Winogradskyella wandonensis TaxID=1442586 RepID=A0A4R1KRT5_9FLAO|nr:phosphoethanolamine transferase [Winogradskyella wandonensis]TCK66839.1 heptose-I-phosphate ethanolaminephosphotransferase [Winogradskyella wandonensis]